MDLSQIPVVDTHCHPFDPSREKDDFRVYFNMSLWPPQDEVIVNTVIIKKMIRELGKLIGLPDAAGQDEILQLRNKLYASDRKGYIEKLLGDANVEIMLVDTGFPHEEFTGYSVDLKTFKELVPCRVFPVFRISSEVNEILKKPPSTFEEARDIIEKRLKHAVQVEKVVAIKSIIAYETGLDIRKWKEKDADEAYGRFRKRKNKGDEKVLRDYFTVMGLKKAGKHDIPIQFHTGFGSAPVLNLYRANPMLLAELLADEEFRGTKVVLTHSGQPFTKEAGYLCSVYPNCYCDVSSITPYSAPSIKNAILEILELAPASRVMMGSDGVMVPETYWFGIKNGVKGLGRALDELVSFDWITPHDAVEFAELILYENAKRLYRV